MLKELFQKQKRILDAYFEAFDLEACERLVERLFACNGTLFLTGVGKSGFIAQKLAATLFSTGTRAHFLAPLDALHGDLGMMAEGDLVLILSNSGETEELFQLLSGVEMKKAESIAITSNATSRLAQEADQHFLLPCVEELCPFDLAPTSSTEIQLLFGDLVAVALMEKKNFSLNDFALNHPAGRIGRRMSVRVKDLMVAGEKAPICSPEDRLQDVLFDFSSKRCGCLVAIDEKKELKGILTDGDLRRALEKKGEGILEQKVSEIMSPLPKTISSESLAWEAMRVMEADPERPITVLPVVQEDEECIGLVKLHDIIQSGV